MEATPPAVVRCRPAQATGPLKAARYIIVIVAQAHAKKDVRVFFCLLTNNKVLTRDNLTKEEKIG
jgi:hypothetical protein